MLFDTHLHASFSELSTDPKTWIDAALARDVRGMCWVSSDPESISTTRNLWEVWQKKLHAQNVSLVWSSGLHPHQASEWSAELANHIENDVLHNGASAVGETGLDFFYNHSSVEQQLHSFRWHLDLAKRSQKPLVLHCRNARKELIEELQCLRGQHSNPGVFHCFTEDWETAKKALDLGLFISFSGILSFKNAHELREVAQKVPLSQLLIETDSPFLAPVPHRGKSNQPAFLADTFSVLASVRSENRDTLEDALWRNSCRVFGVDPG